MRGIKKDFFGNQVLTDINFTLGAGQVLGLCGENGAGKSTLMKILFGMDVIRETGGYSGDIFINGEKAAFNTPFDALAAGIGMVHQEFSLIPGFTATENILLNREPQKKNVISEVFGERLNTLDYKEMDRRAAAAIEKMGVEIDAKMVISSMPVGHKQFTEIARELSKDRLKLLILDEPTAVLTEKDPGGVRPGGGHAGRPCGPGCARRPDQRGRHHPLDGGPGCAERFRRCGGEGRTARR